MATWQNKADMFTGALSVGRLPNSSRSSVGEVESSLSIKASPRCFSFSLEMTLGVTLMYCAVLQETRHESPVFFKAHCCKLAEDCSSARMSLRDLGLH